MVRLRKEEAKKVTLGVFNVPYRRFWKYTQIHSVRKNVVI
jgi:hypothetical protein